MKTLLAFLAGSLATTFTVVIAGGYHAGMLLLGSILTLLGLVAVVWALGIPRVCRWLLALHSANSAVSVGALQGDRPRSETFRRSRSGVSKSGPHVVKSPSVLCRVQQDVLSALVNLRMPFSQAETAVVEAYQKGDSFEDLFKRTVPTVRRSA